ncbi:hypothetical protein NIES25_56640 (plasmid) [Nostoc linckia NIES-25]|nr:hypothetical protein NIES25_56640 [Nostoc linckia NIES-25]
MASLSTDASGYGKASLRDAPRSLLLRRSTLTHLKLPRAKDDPRAVNVQRHTASNQKPYTAHMKVSVGLFGLENNVFTSLSETNLFNIPCCITC